MNIPLLSIIIPTFNSASSIRRALDSIFFQDFTDYEIWIIDGKSTDDTLQIVQEYSRNFNSINLISQQDQGVYDAMNHGAILARGQWLYFMGSDDFLYDASVLGKVGIYLVSKKYDLVYGNVFKEDTNEIYDGKFHYEKLLRKNICHQAMFLRKRVFERYGPFDLRYVALSDHDLNLKLFKNNVAAKHVNLTIANFSKGGISAVFYDKAFHERYSHAYSDYYKNILNRAKRKATLLYKRYFGNKVGEDTKCHLQ